MQNIPFDRSVDLSHLITPDLPPTGMTLAIRVLRLQAGSKSPVSVLAFVH